MSREIYVYEAWQQDEPALVGTLFVDVSNGKEIFSFEYDRQWLTQYTQSYDPDLQLYQGRQYLNNDKPIFGCFADASPDRWGRMLMQRRESIYAKQEKRHPKKLLESDFLLGVYDTARIGSLRFRNSSDGDFLANDEQLAIPPWVELGKLEQASFAFENGDLGNEEQWFNMLIAPGSSLGGARPKATVQDEQGNLWIAKFPSKHDEYDSGAWEMVVHDLAVKVGLNVPKAKLEKFSETGSTFLVRRFDRENAKRLHFASAMTLLGRMDGDTGTSYLDMVKFITSHGSRVEQDLVELWKRIAFSMLVGNTDDHLRNHGFLLEGNGWCLSPIFDVNPVPYGDNLGLMVDSVSSLIDKELLLSTVGYYGLTKKKGQELLQEMGSIVSDNWQKLAKRYGINRNSILYMESAFNRV